MKVKLLCPQCAGKGVLPPLGFAGLEADVPERLDVKRNFERPCTGCDGSGERWVEVVVAETEPVALATQALLDRLRKRL